MIIALFRMLSWVALCALGYLVYPDFAPVWIVAGIAGCLLFFRLAPRQPRQSKPSKLDWVVIDGSNVMHWFDDTPSLSTVASVVEQLTDLGYLSIVWFDANVGYKVGSRYMTERDLARFLPVSSSAIRVAPKGSPADPLLLAEAVRLRGRVVSNDKFRDWTKEFPQLRDDAFLVRATIHGTGLTMEIKPAKVAE